MRHKVAGKHLGRNTKQRTALRRTLMTQFFTHERIVTTRAKTEAIRGEAERMITKAKRALATDDTARQVFVRRLLRGRLDSDEAVTKVFSELAPRYKDRPGGYTRVYKLGRRKGDSAEMVILEFVDRTPKPTEGEDDATTTTGGGIGGRARGLLNRVRGPRRPAQAAESANAGDKPSESSN